MDYGVESRPDIRQLQARQYMCCAGWVYQHTDSSLADLIVNIILKLSHWLSLTVASISPFWPGYTEPCWSALAVTQAGRGYQKTAVCWDCMCVQTALQAIAAYATAVHRSLQLRNILTAASTSQVLSSEQCSECWDFPHIQQGSNIIVVLQSWVLSRQS